jgi:3-oxoacyl-(acyl-carrier-protein) synthase
MASSRIRRRRPTATWDEVRGGWNRGEGVGILFVEQREEAKVSAPLAHKAALPRLAAMDYRRSTPAAQGTSRGDDDLRLQRWGIGG